MLPRARGHSSRLRPFRQHAVILHAGTKVIGIRNPLVRAPGGTLAGSPSSAVPEFQLELQNQPARALIRLVALFAANQHFALDGDSIILASSRILERVNSTACRSASPKRKCAVIHVPELVVNVENSRGAIGTPLVVGPRHLSDSEFWDFVATDGFDRDPTSGFVRVATASDLVNAINDATWGTVIKLDQDASFDVSHYARSLPLPDGVTIRGDRRGTLPGPLILVSGEVERCVPDGNLGLALDDRGVRVLFDQRFPGGFGHNVRFTGLRIQGPCAPGTGRDSRLALFSGIGALDERISLIDHNELSQWTLSPVEVFGPSPSVRCGSPQPPTTLDNVRVVRNFVHNNETWKYGLGTVMQSGANATITGNTFSMNRHAIADDGTAVSGYRAFFNLVLSNAPSWTAEESGEGQSFGPQQDFDMHGSSPDTHHSGGTAGNYVDIAWNTFFGGNRPNYSLRGTPCGTPCGVNYFHDNVTEQNQNGAIESFDPSSVRLARPAFADAYIPIHELFVFGNGFSPAYSDPTVRLGIGDFDGDGIQDLFLATGSAWFYSPGGVTEWRSLAGGRTDPIDTLLFGDFDGDGRTDVVSKNGTNLMVSWGGISDWEVLNTNFYGSISDLAVGNFVGDQRDDLFYADGSEWRVSDAGRGSFVRVADSTFRVRDLRFGDFDGDGRTDVFGIVSGAWRVAYSAPSPRAPLAWTWTFLRSPLSDNINELTVADFNGDGIADVATSIFTLASDGSPLPVVNWDWKVSFGGVGDWTFLHRDSVPLAAAAGIGRFAGNAESDVLLWGWEDNDKLLAILLGGSGAKQRQSRQEMR